MANSSFSLSGLASGFDWKSFINQIMAVEAAPINRLNAEKNTALDKLNSLSTLQSNMTALKTSAAALAADGLFGGRTAASTTASSSWSAVAGTNTATGTYRIAVTQLADASRIQGGADISSGLNATNDVTGLTLSTMRSAVAVTAGTFTVNGQQVTVATSDSLQTIFDRISTATGTAVTGAYSSATDKITLSGASPIILGAGNDTSNFLQALGLANNGTGTVTSGAALGTLATSSPLTSSGLRAAITAVDGSGNGTFNVNGVAIAYNVNTDTTSTVMKRITDSTAGVTATYDNVADRMVLTNKSTGDLGVAVSETGAGLASALGLVSGASLVRGQNALFTVNGGSAFISTSNTLTATAHGITGLSVTANTLDTQTIQVSADTGSMKTAINRFITDYNSVQAFVEQQTKITTNPTTKKVVTSTLTTNREIQDWSETLRRTAFNEVAGLTGTIKRLEHLGIDFKTDTSELKITDSAKLDAALSTKPDDVKAFFGTATTGFAAKFGTFLDNVLATSGSMATQQATLTKGNTSIDDQIANIQRRLDQQRELLTNSFIAMESAQAKLQQQSTALNNSFFKNTTTN